MTESRRTADLPAAEGLADSYRLVWHSFQQRASKSVSKDFMDCAVCRTISETECASFQKSWTGNDSKSHNNAGCLTHAQQLRQESIWARCADAHAGNAAPATKSPTVQSICCSSSWSGSTTLTSEALICCCMVFFVTCFSTMMFCCRGTT